jgi:hypothetical protein
MRNARQQLWNKKDTPKEKTRYPAGKFRTAHSRISDQGKYRPAD